MDFLTQTYRKYWSELCAIIRRKFGSGPPDPEDVAQSAFERLGAAMQDQTIENPRAFLIRCAKNYVLDHKRRQVVRDRFAVDARTLNLLLGTDEFDGQRVLEAKDRLSCILKALDDLEPRRRRILLMHAVDELSFAEIARQMNLSHTRVMQLFSDAMAACVFATEAFDGAGDETKGRTS